MMESSCPPNAEPEGHSDVPTTIVALKVPSSRAAPIAHRHRHNSLIGFLAFTSVLDQTAAYLQTKKKEKNISKEEHTSGNLIIACNLIHLVRKDS